MSVSINSNVAAFQAHSKMVDVNGKMQKMIKRLSSGLRINGAADDPSGLAISQRLHTQLSGLNRAALNVQDAISFLQTAENSLSESQSILQRMRELSVQAANGTLIATDRGEIQKEVNQLIEEVDRIAKSTEFNTKKLLDGSSSALWSSTSDDVNVVVRGQVAEGNYELEIDTDPVPNHVLKTDIFALKSQATGVDNVNLSPVKASVDFEVNAASTVSCGTLTFDFGAGVEYSVNLSAGITASDVATSINHDEELSDYVLATVSTQNATSIVTFEAVVPGEEGNFYSVRSDNSNAAGIPTTAVYTFGSGNDYPTGIVDVGNPMGLPASTEKQIKYQVAVDNEVMINPLGDTSHIAAVYEQPVGDGITAATTTGALATAALGPATATITAHEGSGYAIVEVVQGGEAGVDAIVARVSFDQGQTWYTTDELGDSAGTGTTGVVVSDGEASFEIATITAGSILNEGDKILMALNDENYNNETHAELQVTSPFADGQSNTTQVGPSWSFTSDLLNNKTTSVDVGYLDSGTGDITFGTVDVSIEQLQSGTSNNSAIATDTGISTIEFDVAGGGGVAFRSTKLWQIDRFYDNQGNFILGEHGQSITIYNANGDKSTFYIDPDDTIGEVADKIEDSIKKSEKDGGLGMGTGDSRIDDHIADYVTEATPLSDEAVKGTIVVRSPQMGPRGKLYFSAEEDLLNALSLVTIQTPDVDPMTIKVRNAHTGDLVGEDTVHDNTLRGVVEGVDIEFNPNLDVQVSWDPAHKKYLFENASGTVKEYVHIVDNSTSFQIGANEGQILDSYIAEMTAHALGVDRVLVVTQDLAQDSIARMDNAIDMVSSERARIGALVNRLEHTYNNLSVQSANAYASESAIKDLDVAEAATEFSKLQILSQAATSMLAQANKLPENLLQLLR